MKRDRQLANIRLIRRSWTGLGAANSPLDMRLRPEKRNIIPRNRESLSEKQKKITMMKWAQTIRKEKERWLFGTASDDANSKVCTKFSVVLIFQRRMNIYLEMNYYLCEANTVIAFSIFVGERDGNGGTANACDVSSPQNGP